jgi:hypothetical protein
MEVYICSANSSELMKMKISLLNMQKLYVWPLQCHEKIILLYSVCIYLATSVTICSFI